VGSYPSGATHYLVILTPSLNVIEKNTTELKISI
jgi:hypothetical protein